MAERRPSQPHWKVRKAPFLVEIFDIRRPEHGWFVHTSEPNHGAAIARCQAIQRRPEWRARVRCRIHRQWVTEIVPREARVRQAS